VKLTEWGKSVKVAPNEVKFASIWLWFSFSNLWRAYKIILQIHTQQNSPHGLTVNLSKIYPTSAVIIPNIVQEDEKMRIWKIKSWSEIGTLWFGIRSVPRIERGCTFLSLIPSDKDIKLAWGMARDSPPLTGNGLRDKPFSDPAQHPSLT